MNEWLCFRRNGIVAKTSTRHTPTLETGLGWETAQTKQASDVNIEGKVYSMLMAWVKEPDIQGDFTYLDSSEPEHTQIHEWRCPKVKLPRNTALESPRLHCSVWIGMLAFEIKLLVELSDGTGGMTRCEQTSYPCGVLASLGLEVMANSRARRTKGNSALLAIIHV